MREHQREHGGHTKSAVIFRGHLPCWRGIVVFMCVMNAILIIFTIVMVSVGNSRPKYIKTIDFQKAFNSDRTLNLPKMKVWTYTDIRVQHDKPAGYEWFFDDGLLNSALATVDMKYMPNAIKNRPGFTQFTLVNRKKGQTKFRAIYCKYTDFKGFDMKIDGLKVRELNSELMIL